MTERGCQRDPWDAQWSGEREQKQEIHSFISQKKRKRGKLSDGRSQNKQKVMFFHIM